MFRSAWLQRIGGRLALLASLSGVLLPAIGMAMPAQPGSPQDEVCTSSGSRWAVVGQTPLRTPGNPASGQASAHDDHCALCTATGAATPLPTDSGTQCTVPGTAIGPPTASAVEPRMIEAWRIGRPRGPPTRA